MHNTLMRKWAVTIGGRIVRPMATRDKSRWWRSVVSGSKRTPTSCNFEFLTEGFKPRA